MNANRASVCFIVPALLAALAWPLHAADAGGPVPTLQEAVALVQHGKESMRAADADPPRIVDAAIAFGKALKTYEQAQDIDMVTDIQANIFWCKKKMNLPMLEAYLAKTGGGKDQATKDALDRIDEIANAKVDASKAKDYYDRAQAFATKNPKDYRQIAVRWFEVATRFADHELGKKAQELSLAALGEAMKDMNAQADAQQAARSTLFSRPAKAAAGARMTVPAADLVKASRAEVRKFYKDDFAKTQRKHKARLADKLMAEAAKTKDDPKLLYALLQEARQVAVEAAAWDEVLRACDLLADRFEGVDAAAERKATCEKAKGDSVASAMLKLMADPADAAANLVVGRCFAQLGAWDEAIPMFAASSDALLKRAAEMEISKPDGASQVADVGDAWFEAGKKAPKGPERDAYLSRAAGTYQRVVAQLTGITKEKVARNMEEIENTLPLGSLDYSNLTAKQWDRLKGQIVVVEAKRDSVETGLVLTPGKRVRVVPHPTETWTLRDYDGPYTTTAKGRKSSFYFREGGTNPGTLMVRVGTGPMRPFGIVEGPGLVYCMANRGSWDYGDAGGAIRVKLVPVTDED